MTNFFDKLRIEENETLFKNVKSEIKKKFNEKAIKEFIENNQNFLEHHTFNVEDMLVFLKIQNIFKIRQDIKTPQELDVVEITIKGVLKYEKARIINLRKDDNSICVNPYPPYVCIKENILTGNDTSGGYFMGFKPSKLKYKSIITTLVWVFGSCGATGNGGIYIPVKTNLWTLDNPDNFY